MQRQNIKNFQLNFSYFYFSVFEIDEDRKYGIKFKSGKFEVTLVIEICEEFPYKTPKLSLDPNLSHQWIEGEEIKNFPGLINVS